MTTLGRLMPAPAEKGLMMATMPQTSSASAAMLFQRMASPSSRKASSVTNSGLPENSTATMRMLPVGQISAHWPQPTHLAGSTRKFLAFSATIAGQPLYSSRLSLYSGGRPPLSLPARTFSAIFSAVLSLRFWAMNNGETPSCRMWRNIAAQDPSFGHPDKFFKDIKETSWESWTVDTANKEILAAVEKICHRDPLSGKVVSGGIVTCKDSSWLVSWTINRQGQFLEQPTDHCLIWVYGLNCWNDKGDFIKKNMCDCNGIELCAEWLYHIGIPENEIMLALSEATLRE